MVKMSKSPNVELEQFDSSGKQPAAEQSLEEEVVEEKSIKMDPLFQINDYISICKLEKFGTQSDLHRLRQLSGFYYEIINPKYFDLLDNTVEFGDVDTSRWIRNEIKKSSYIKPEEPDASADGEIDQGSSSDDDESDDLLEGERKKIDIIGMKSSGPTADYKLITTDNWTGGICHIIRTLELDHINFHPEYPECHGLSVPTLISQMSPYVTTLQINLIPTVKDYYGQGTKFSEFMNQMTNLKLLKLMYLEHQHEYSEQLELQYIKTMEVAQLEIMIKSLNRKTRVEITVVNGYSIFLSQFKSTANTKLIFDFYDDFYEDGISDFTLFKEVARNLELYPTENLIELTGISVYLGTADDVKEFTTLCLQHKEKFQDLHLCMTDLDYEEQDASDIRKYLTLLSPIVTEMRVGHIDGTKVCDILSTGLDEDGWKNLTSFTIYDGYMYPLDILKKCPKLSTLSLNVSPECFFHDKSKTDKEVMIEYFGNLPSLTRFEYGVQLGDKFGIDGEPYLKTLLPKETTIEGGKQRIC